MSPFKELFGGIFSRAQQKRPKTDDADKSPLAQAKEIQSKERRRDPRLRENHRRPTQLPHTSFTSPSSGERSRSHLNRGTKKRGRRHHFEEQPSAKETSTDQTSVEPKKHSSAKRTRSETVDLCTSNSDTDNDSVKMSAKSAQKSACSERSQSESEGIRRFRKQIEEKRRQAPDKPKYPTSQLLVATNQTKDQSDDENDSVRMQNKNSSRIRNLELVKDENGDDNSRKNRKSMKNREISRERQEIINTGSSPNIIDGHDPKNKHESNEFESYPEFCMDKAEKPRKKGLEMTVPALKQLRPRRKKKGMKRQIRYTEDNYTEDLKDDCNIYNDGNDDTNNDLSYVDGMKDVIDSIAIKNLVNSIDDPKSNDAIPTANSTTNPYPTRNNSFASSSLSVKKVNIKGRKRKKPSTIVPGASFTMNNNPQQNADQSQWRSVKDQDEYHTQNAEEQVLNDMDFNPLTGGSYQHSRGATTRSRKQYGARTEQLEGRKDSPPRKLPKRTKKQIKPETIDILSSDSEDDNIVVEDESNILNFPLKRLAVGQDKVYNNQDHQPMIIFDNEENAMQITFSKRKNRNNAREKIHIGLSEIAEVSYCAMDDVTLTNLGKEVDADLDSFIFVSGNGRMKSMSTKNRKKDFQLVLEFDDEMQLNDLVSNLSDELDEGRIHPVPPEDIDMVAAPLISDSKNKYNLRNRVTPHKIDPFISQRKGDEILLVYPFGVDKNKMEAAADGLQELSWRETFEGENQELPEPENDNKVDSATLQTDNKSSDNIVTMKQTGQRSHFIEIRVEDYEKLDTGQWLNDSLIDMWMQWISRHISCKQSSNLHFFTSHFYTTLASEGVAGVRSWTAKKNINIFNKRLIFIPINKTLHWSLCVVVNPGAIITPVDDDEDNDLKDRELPCMLFFDSLNMHRKARVHRDVVKWLNSEWKRTTDSNNEPFSKQSCKIYDPQVPRQNNGSDCGVFVCRYAFAMFQLRHLKFSYGDAGLDPTNYDQRASRRQRGTGRPQPFSELITNGKEFDFDVDDIQRIRHDFKALIRNLHPLYQVVKDDRIKAEKEEKKARKRRKEKETGTIQITELVENNAVKTCPTTKTSNLLNATDNGNSNELSDSSKENFIPREDEEIPAQKMPMQNDEGRQQASSDVLLSDASQQQRLLRTPTAMKDDSVRLKSRDDDAGGIGTPSSVVAGEEMADNENIVHF